MISIAVELAIADREMKILPTICLDSLDPR